MPGFTITQVTEAVNTGELSVADAVKYLNTRIATNGADAPSSRRAARAVTALGGTTPEPVVVPLGSKAWKSQIFARPDVKNHAHPRFVGRKAIAAVYAAEREGKTLTHAKAVKQAMVLADAAVKAGILS